ncbi:hypothetical protein DSO57_1006334 [Entomophthora muscae]|uniref:Uncharacterized protein n=1 Tax=Entomophthora muscae TaxID=34485 RepID=A0ACC2U5E7_9FUNG|nr:hypothetical protein DSO57_1006334 [Entomophthora muscae]
MQAKYKLQPSHTPQLGNKNSFQPVPSFNPGHTMGTGEQEPHKAPNSINFDKTVPHLDFYSGLVTHIRHQFDMSQCKKLHDEFLKGKEDLNPDPEFLRAASPKYQGAAYPHCPGVKPLQAEAKNDGPNDEASQPKIIIAPNKGIIKVPNRGNKIPTISLMSLKITPAANQESPPGEGTGLQLNPMTATLEQDNQVSNLRFLTNERTPVLGAILLPLNPSTQIPRAHFSQCPDEPPMKNIKFGGGVLLL